MLPAMSAGDGICDRESQRVVPRGDEAHHADRRAELPGLRKEGQGARRRRGQQARGVQGIETGDDCGIQNLFECVAARLSRFQLDEVQDFVLPTKQQIVKPEEDCRPIGKGAYGPGRLCAPGANHRLFHIRIGPGGNAAEQFAGKRSVSGDLIVRLRGHCYVREQFAGQLRPDTFR